MIVHIAIIIIQNGWWVRLPPGNQTKINNMKSSTFMYGIAFAVVAISLFIMMNVVRAIIIGSVIFLISFALIKFANWLRK